MGHILVNLLYAFYSKKRKKEIAVRNCEQARQRTTKPPKIILGNLVIWYFSFMSDAPPDNPLSICPNFRQAQTHTSHKKLHILIGCVNSTYPSIFIKKDIKEKSLKLHGSSHLYWHTAVLLQLKRWLYLTKGNFVVAKKRAMLLGCMELKSET